MVTGENWQTPCVSLTCPITQSAKLNRIQTIMWTTELTPEGYLLPENNDPQNSINLGFPKLSLKAGTTEPLAICNALCGWI